MHGGRADNIACSEHQQHICLQRNQSLVLPRLAPLPHHSFWQSRTCQAATIAQVRHRGARRGAGWAGRGGCAGQGRLTSWAEAATIRPDALALTSPCAR